MYKIPKRELVESAIREVLREHSEISSQNLFHSLVQGMVRREDKEYRVSPDRVRQLAAVMDGVKVHAEKRRTSREAKRCYVCGGELAAVKTRDLFGNEALAGKRCSTCGFEMERENLVPKRYFFLRG
ncbi:MAG: hypothetical protein V3T58_04505 [Candidatus Hydrothermarchaeales archaeon]